MSDREFHKRMRRPYRVRLPLWASLLLTVVVLVGAATALKPKRVS